MSRPFHSKTSAATANATPSGILILLTFLALTLAHPVQVYANQNEELPPPYACSNLAYHSGTGISEAEAYSLCDSFGSGFDGGTINGTSSAGPTFAEAQTISNVKLLPWEQNVFYPIRSGNWDVTVSGNIQTVSWLISVSECTGACVGLAQAHAQGFVKLTVYQVKINPGGSTSSIPMESSTQTLFDRTSSTPGEQDPGETHGMDVSITIAGLALQPPSSTLKGYEFSILFEVDTDATSDSASTMSSQATAEIVNAKISTVAFIDLNQPPQTPHTPIGPNTGLTGISYTYHATGTDPDEDPVTITFDWGDGQTQQDTEGTASHSWDNPGTYCVKAMAKDPADATSSWSNCLDVAIGPETSTNNPPILNPIGPKTAIDGTPLTFTATATDPDLGQTLTFSLTDCPLEATIDPTSGQFTWTPTEPEASVMYTCTIIVQDNGQPPLSDSETITIGIQRTSQPTSPSVPWHVRYWYLLVGGAWAAIALTLVVAIARKKASTSLFRTSTISFDSILP